jgi:hypothetical protein
MARGHAAIAEVEGAPVYNGHDQQEALVPVAAVSPIDDTEKVFVSQTNPEDYAATSSVPSMGSSAAQSNGSSRIQELRVAKARLEERRSRLLALQAIDSEEEKLNQELIMLENKV